MNEAIELIKNFFERIHNFSERIKDFFEPILIAPVDPLPVKFALPMGLIRLLLWTIFIVAMTALVILRLVCAFILGVLFMVSCFGIIGPLFLLSFILKIGGNSKMYEITKFLYIHSAAFVLCFGKWSISGDWDYDFALNYGEFY